ncbi:hypothetical protein NMV45_05665 [Pasteurella multocida]|uniref:hypothetical protein n=1 Tax=Pasteurella multocida TaxID=747 RepID=UPI0002F79783|nr:hypothetical protein [Pasteurella multocida]QDA13926.1 hypothetical protein E0Z11_02610 [Pasteurella multocida subsp. multocida]MDY0487339.1 hypothetical protein [Pasteurella multocida]MDY0594972.1 hypothetical protein [Pasteurella multocida]MDY0664279.1 hypothetical protein [Pasteurella multocida]MDY0666483.1 hypothetical protein [Pasteurella multocida]
MKEKHLAAIERFKESGERATLNIALSEWAYEKLKNHEVLDENSLREWATSPKCSKGKSLALLNFLEAIKASTKTDK